MKTKSTMHVLRASAAAGLLGLAASAQGADMMEIRLLTSPSGSGPYNAFATIQTHMDEFSDKLRIRVEETPGFNYNVKYMGRNSDAYANTIFGSGTVLDWAARTGHEPFYPEPLEAMADFRIVAVMGLTWNVWVTTDSGIRTPRDFVGKRVGIGLLTQNEWGMHQRMLLDGWNLTPKLASLDSLGTSPNIEALLDGRTDVGTLFGLTSSDGSHTVVTGPHRQLEAAKRDWHYVNVPAEMIESFKKETGAPFRVVSYPAGTLPKQEEPLTTFGDILVLRAHKSLPDEAAYEFVRVLVENYDQIGQYSAFTRVWTGETLAASAEDNPENFHPGSLRAFRDLGIIE